MTKLVFDSDGIIKLTKSGIVNRVIENFNCFISDRVHTESVIEGKDRLYEDAFQIGDLVEKNKLRVIKVKGSNKAEKILGEYEFLGEGEKSTLHLFFNINAKAIVSDDQAFLNLLYRNNVPFIIPSYLIVRLSELKILDKKESLSALERIKPHIKESNYLKAKRNIEVI